MNYAVAALWEECDSEASWLESKPTVTISEWHEPKKTRRISPASACTINLATKKYAEIFERLKLEWKTATRFSSSATEIIRHPAYQQIIQLGMPVVPLIIKELLEQPDHWFGALRAITQEDPVHKEVRGDIDAMAQAWITWAESRGL